MTNLAYQCCYCKEKNYINTKSRIKTHIYKYHLPLEQAPFYCGLCLFRCETQHDLQRHRISYPLHRQRVKDYSNSSTNFDDATYLHKSSRPYILTNTDFVCLNRPYVGQKKKHCVSNNVASTKDKESKETCKTKSLAASDHDVATTNTQVKASSSSTLSTALPLTEPVVTVSAALRDPGATDQEDWMVSQPILSMPYLDDIIDSYEPSLAPVTTSTMFPIVSLDCTVSYPETSRNSPSSDLAATLISPEVKSSTTSATITSSLSPAINTTAMSIPTIITSSTQVISSTITQPSSYPPAEDHFQFDLDEQHSAAFSPTPSSPSPSSSDSDSESDSDSGFPINQVIEKLDLILERVRKQEETIKSLEGSIKNLENIINHQGERQRGRTREKENERWRYRERSPLQSRRYR